MTTFDRVELRAVTTTETVIRPGETPTTTTRKVTTSRYRVDGVAAVSMYADDRGRLYVPTGVTVETVDRGLSTLSTTVTGRLQRKDGSLGATEHVIHRFSWHRGDRPAWLADIVANHRRGVRA